MIAENSHQRIDREQKKQEGMCEGGKQLMCSRWCGYKKQETGVRRLNEITQ